MVKRTQVINQKDFQHDSSALFVFLKHSEKDLKSSHRSQGVRLLGFSQHFHPLPWYLSVPLEPVLAKASQIPSAQAHRLTEHDLSLSSQVQEDTSGEEKGQRKEGIWADWAGMQMLWNA